VFVEVLLVMRDHDSVLIATTATDHRTCPSVFAGSAISAVVLFLMALVSMVSAQQSVLTSRYDTARSGANTQEYLLAPSNVGKTSFGRLWTAPVDYEVLAQPLYVPNVTIKTGQFQGTVHNVVYVATMTDSVYALDADDGAQLWYASVVDGGVPASGEYLPCGHLGGFTSEGIVGTPVIDLSTNTIFLVAKSLFNGTVFHYLHALDISTGLDQVFPLPIAATSRSIQGRGKTFTSLHQKNRPGLALVNGVLYMGFGSNGCNDGNTGWVLAYDTTNFQQLGFNQVGVFNTSPDIGFASIWQTGNGLAADEAGNVFVSTAESTQVGLQIYGNSILKLTPDFPWNFDSQNPNQPADYFMPWNVSFLDGHDLDVSSTGPVLLPDQSPGPPTCSQNPCHEVLASGKQGIIYVIDRDNMSGFSQDGTDHILQEYSLLNNGELMASPAYWNGLVYYTPGGTPIQSLQVTSGSVPLVPFAQTTQRYIGAHAPTISASGNTNGILWVLSGSALDALDAISLKLLYTSDQSGTRDKLPKLAHFATPTVANGMVYVATLNTVEAYGLFHILSVTGGNNQTAQVLNPLPAPLQVVANDPYTGQPVVGTIVSFSDGNKGGFFNPPSNATDSQGMVSTSYTCPKKAGTYTIEISAPTFGNITATETCAPGAPIKLLTYKGARQTGIEGSVLPKPLVAEALDAYGNPVPGVTVTFSSNHGGSFNPQATVTTDARGFASTNFQLPMEVVKLIVTASSPGLKSATFVEFSIAGLP
jgi:outer membrane protein assembly factor BamB